MQISPRAMSELSLICKPINVNTSPCAAIAIVRSIKFAVAKLIWELYRQLWVPVRSLRNYIVCECFSPANFTCWAQVNIWCPRWCEVGHFWILALFKLGFILPTRSLCQPRGRVSSACFDWCELKLFYLKPLDSSIEITGCLIIK